MYTLLVCGDMYGEKANLEITFPNMPTIGDIQRKVTEIFSAESALKRPSGFPSVDFCVSKIQIYDDVMLRWTDLMSCSQLHEYDQLYVFQPQSPWHIDVQKDLPPPRPPTIVQQNFSGNYSARSIPGNQSVFSNQSANYAASPSHQSPYGRPAGGSPTQQRLEEQRRREEQMRQELNRMREETERLEREAANELEEERRRQKEEHDRLVRQMSDDIRQQREALARSEEEMKRLQSS